MDFGKPNAENGQKMANSRLLFLALYIYIYIATTCRNIQIMDLMEYIKLVHISMQVLSNPFSDIVPRDIKRKVKSEKQSKPKSQSKATK